MRQVEAACAPVREKPDLLLPQKPDELDQPARRPADVFLPHWQGGRPAALDFAVVAPHLVGTLPAAAQSACAAASAYADKKRKFLNTERLCEQQGFAFIPMVCESTGAWDPNAAAILKRLCKVTAAKLGEDHTLVWHGMLQRLSVHVRRSRARAALRRRAECSPLREDGSPARGGEELEL